jgi:hypothetical protein
LTRQAPLTETLRRAAIRNSQAQNKQQRQQIFEQANLIPFEQFG